MKAAEVGQEKRVAVLAVEMFVKEEQEEHLLLLLQQPPQPRCSKHENQPERK